MSRLRERLDSRGLLERVEAIVTTHHTTIELVESRDRSASVARARKLAYAALCEAGLSTAEVGRIFNRDHTTVMAGINTAYRAPTMVDPTCPHCSKPIKWTDGKKDRSYAVGACGCAFRSWRLKVLKVTRITG